MRRRHEHQRREIAVWYPQSLAAAMAGTPQTIVLRRCSCGDLDTVTLAGKWTLEQVRGGVQPVAARVPALL